MNSHTRYDNILLDTKVALYLRTGVHYHYGHNQDSYYNYLFSGKQKTEHENTAADILGTVFEQTSEFMVDCELI